MCHILVANNFISDLLEYLGTVSTQNDLMPILAARGKGDKFDFYFLLISSSFYWMQLPVCFAICSRQGERNLIGLFKICSVWGDLSVKELFVSIELRWMPTTDLA